jgi:hypothetical protein
MNARILSIAAAVVLSAASVGAFAQSTQDTQSQQQASQQTAPAKHHRFYNFVESHVTPSHGDIYHGH